MRAFISISRNYAANKNLLEQAQLYYQMLVSDKTANGTIGEIIAEHPKSRIKVSDAKGATGEYPFYTSGIAVLEYPDYLVEGRNILLNTGGTAGVKFHVGKVAYSTDTWCIYGKNYYTDFLYLLLLGLEREIESIYFEGATLKHLQKSKLKAREIYLPSEKELMKLNSVICPMFDMISDNNRENKRLSTTRDVLLPKLMSGEIDVSDIEL